MGICTSSSIKRGGRGRQGIMYVCAGTVWCLHFVGLNFHELLFENISLENFANSRSKCHTRGVLHLKTPVHAELNYHFVGALYSANLPHFDVLSVRFQIPGHSPDLRRIELAASVFADIAHDGTSWENSPCGPRSLH